MGMDWVTQTEDTIGNEIWKANRNRIIALIGDGVLKWPSGNETVDLCEVSSEVSRLTRFAERHVLTGDGIKNLIASYFQLDFHKTVFNVDDRLVSRYIYVMLMDDDKIAVGIGHKFQPRLKFQRKIHKINHMNGISCIFYSTIDEPNSRNLHDRNTGIWSAISTDDELGLQLSENQYCNMSKSYRCDICHMDDKPVKLNCHMCNWDVCESCSSEHETYDFMNAGCNNSVLLSGKHRHAMIRNDTVSIYHMHMMDTRNCKAAIVIDGIFSDDTSWYSDYDSEYESD